MIKKFIIINGKGVEIYLDPPEKAELPQLDSNRIKNIIKRASLNRRAKKSKNPLLISLVRFYLANDVANFLECGKEIVEQQFIEVLKKYPKYITTAQRAPPNNPHSNNVFVVGVALAISTREIFALYLSNKSSNDRAVFAFNLFSLIILFNKDIFATLFIAIVHEFDHHLDRNKLARRVDISERLLNQPVPHENLPPNFRSIFYLINLMREEGITFFISSLKQWKRVSIDVEYLNIIAKILKLLSSDFGSDGMELIKEHELFQYWSGAMMVAMIVTMDIFARHMEFLVSIKSKQFGENTDVKKSDFVYLYGHENCSLAFIEDRDMDDLMEDTLKRLRLMNQNQFLAEYEKSCEFFEIPQKLRYFNADSYHYYSTLCIYNYKKFKFGIDDQKIKAQVEKFRR